MPFEPSNYATLSAMITPALFMTANGSLIISTSNRMARVVDRIRVLNDLTDSICRGEKQIDYAELRMEHFATQLNHLEWRSDRVRYALGMLYLAFSSFVGTSLALAIDSLIGNRHLTTSMATGLSMIGVSLMFVASINLVREALAALSSNRQEIQFFRNLQSRRIAEHRCSGG
jgi:hypothetical protein